MAYEYGGDLKRRERTSGSDTTWYNWGAGYAVMGEEDGSGNLVRTYVAGTMAHIDGPRGCTETIEGTQESKAYFARVSPRIISVDRR